MLGFKGLNLPIVPIHKRRVWSSPRTLTPKTPQNQSLDTWSTERSAHDRLKAVRSFHGILFQYVNFRQPYWNAGFSQNI